MYVYRVKKVKVYDNGFLFIMFRIKIKLSLRCI